MSRISCKCCSKGFDTLKEPYYCPNCGADNNSDLADTPVNTPTLRDQFAMSALQGILANQQCAPFSYAGDVEQSVRCAYRLADAMLEARK